MWATPLATAPDPVKTAVKQFREEMMKREEMKDSASNKKNVIGSVVWTGGNASVLATVGRSPSQQAYYDCPDAKGDPTTAMTFSNVACTPSVGCERDVVDVEANAPPMCVEEVDIKGEGRIRRLIRRWRYELAWMCAFDKKPLREEEQLLLYSLRQKEEKLRRKDPFEPAPW